MFERLMGILTFKAPVYRQVAEDTSATGSAALIVIITGILQAIATSVGAQTIADQTGQPNPSGGVVGAVIGGVIGGLLGWLLGSWIAAVVARALGGRTDTGEMLRVTGYGQIFGLIVALIGVLLSFSAATAAIAGFVALIGTVLALIGYVIGLREAAEVSTGKAIVIAIIAALVPFLVVVLIGVVLAALFIGVAQRPA